MIGTGGLIFAGLVVVVLVLCFARRAGRGWYTGSPLEEGQRRDFDYEGVLDHDHEHLMEFE